MKLGPDSVAVHSIACLVKYRHKKNSHNITGAGLGQVLLPI